jgi:hypothetical protein
VQEATHCCPADRALVRLHSHDLTAVNAEAHVPTGENHGVFGCSVAHYALSLTLISDIGSIVVNSVDVIQVHNLIVVQKLLFDEFEAEIL